MPLDGLDHVTICCADLEATRAFYCDVLGLREGCRPDLGFSGHWLYCGDVAVVHLVGPDGRLAENRRQQLSSGGGAADHVAFRGRNAAEVTDRLSARSIAFRETRIDAIGLHQLFVRDPNGIMIEVNFRT
ncbi:MAG: VOC family protein [Alphaproteobacteria bacterium]|nr:VOC family protein [Alphaproteobacteria bacterium]